MSKALTDLAGHVAKKLGEKVEASIAFGELTLAATPDSVLDVLAFLRDDAKCRFVSFIDICGADYPAREKRFDVVYHLMSPVKNLRVRVKVQTDEDTPVPSATAVYPGADWFEREAYDLYGILFSGHPELRRILTDYGFEGHPLRKDFPLTGYVEMRYDEEQQRVFERTKTSGAEAIKLKGGAGWAVGLTIAEVVRAIALDQHKLLPVSTQLAGEYGIRNTCTSVPKSAHRTGRLGRSPRCCRSTALSGG
jgi:NADH-quinone oxidoreductase subunit C